jgi:uncharacterized protein
VVDSHGRFVWYELMTTDMAAAKAFYTSVIGWGSQDASMPGFTYTLFTAGETSVSGLMALPADAKRMGAKPIWIGYVGVDDVDVAAAGITRLGGALLVPPTDISDISRISVATDPQMATVAMFKWKNPGQQQPFDPEKPGHVSWHELLAADWQKAFAFYGEIFGWQKADGTIDPMGTYQLFAAGGQTIGCMFTKPAMVPVPFWLYYFNVGDIDAAAARVKDGGGQVIEGPFDVPGGSRIARCTDPQGAMFALETKRDHSAIGYFERVAPRDPSDPRGRRWSW